MALINLSAVKDDDDYGMSCGPDIYGLCISLNDAQCAALGITKPPRAGAIMGLNAVAVVRRVTEEIDQAGESDKEVYLQFQITHMELKDPPKGLNTAKALYGGD
jgi:hypothetical protein